MSWPMRDLSCVLPLGNQSLASGTYPNIYLRFSWVTDLDMVLHEYLTGAAWQVATFIRVKILIFRLQIIHWRFLPMPATSISILLITNNWCTPIGDRRLSPLIVVVARSPSKGHWILLYRFKKLYKHVSHRLTIQSPACARSASLGLQVFYLHCNIELVSSNILQPRIIRILRICRKWSKYGLDRRSTFLWCCGVRLGRLAEIVGRDQTTCWPVAVSARPIWANTKMLWLAKWVNLRDAGRLPLWPIFDCAFLIVPRVMFIAKTICAGIFRYNSGVYSGTADQQDTKRPEKR